MRRRRGHIATVIARISTVQAPPDNYFITQPFQGGMVRRNISAETKAQILAFIDKYNSRNGRGGQRAAAAKFGVSPTTIVNWLKAGGAASRGKAPAAPTEIKTVIRSRSSGKLISKKMAPIFIALEIIKEGLAALENALKKIA
jgi:transposase-like protein